MTEVLSAPNHGASHFSSDPLRSSSHQNIGPSLNTSIPYPDRSDIKSSFVHTEYETHYQTSAPSSAPSSPQTFSRRPSYSSTPASSLSLDPRVEEDIQFPSFEGSGGYEKSQQITQIEVLQQISEDEPISRPHDPLTKRKSDVPHLGGDDQDMETEPTRHVDYLSHEWKEEDIWSSWRYVVNRRNRIANSVRLENASWRTWMKAKYKLKTISPETLNWLKDCDVTWLYGPLQVDVKKPFHTGTSPPPSRLSHSSSFIHKKPILKKKSASAAILERSISQHSLLKQAGALLRAQQSSPAVRPSFARGVSDFTMAAYTGSSVANTPAEGDCTGLSSFRPSFTCADFHSPAETKHVEFSDTVRQAQGIESDDDERQEQALLTFSDEDEDEDDDGGLMMRPSSSRTSRRGTPRGSFSNESKTITELPSTKLKYRGDTPEVGLESHETGQGHAWLNGHTLSPSPSQETLRPSKRSQNFLLDDDPEDPDMTPWQPQSKSLDLPTPSPYEEEYRDESGSRMRRTGSGMFMPYDENEDEAAMNSTLFGQVMYAANTFKDIAHVVWSVGWRRT